MRATKEERRERERRKREEWQAELARLHRRQDQRQESAAVDRAHERNRRLLLDVHAKMAGPDFRAWYEATTGEPVADFLADVAISPEAFLARFEGRLNQLEWTQYRIQKVAEDNPWRNPERKVLWAKMVAEAKSAGERRRMILRLALPIWADREAVAAIYRERERVSAETGVVHHVDHVVPLVHPLVCGLHCEHNLQILPGAENQTKSNRFEIS